MIELRNKSLRTWLNYFHASIDANLFKKKKSFEPDVLIFFSKFKGLLNQLGRAILVNLLKNRVKSSRFAGEVKIFFFSILSNFVYGCRPLQLANYSLGKTFVKKFVTVIVNLMQMRKSGGSNSLRKFKKIISLMLLFTGFREDLFTGVLIKKYALMFFY